MTPLLAIPAVQAQPPVQTSAVVGMPTQISTIKLPVDAVPSTVNVEQVYNNTRGSGATRMSPVSMGAASVASGNTALMPMIAGLDFRPSVQFSSPFLAQLFSQTPGSQLQAMTEFFVNDNAPKYIADPAMMALFSQVKYKPSNASVPLPGNDHVFNTMRQQQQQFMQQLSDQKAQQIQSQVREAPIAQSSQGPRQIIIHLPNLGGAPTQERGSSTATSTGSPFAAKSFRSLVQPTGVDAYIASFARNQANLTDQPDALKVAL